MPLRARRVVTGHDANGKAIVLFDDILEGISRRPNHANAIVWTTNTTPVDNTGKEDAAQAEVGFTIPDGSVFRLVQYGPGVAPRTHRTDSIDYAVVMSGEIDMELDDGVVVHLKAGDVLVQRGTLHNWVNNGTEACTIAFVLIDAKPVEANGIVLHAKG